MKYIPGILGAILVTAGAAMITPILGLIVAGLFLLVLDWRIG